MRRAYEEGRWTIGNHGTPLHIHVDYDIRIITTAIGLEEIRWSELIFGGSNGHYSLRARGSEGGSVPMMAPEPPKVPVTGLSKGDQAFT